MLECGQRRVRRLVPLARAVLRGECTGVSGSDDWYVGVLVGAVRREYARQVASDGVALSVRLEQWQTVFADFESTGVVGDKSKDLSISRVINRFKNVVFRAGRIECALRLLASGVLCLIIPELDGMDQLNWYKSFQDQIHSCLDDDELVTR